MVFDSEDVVFAWAIGKALLIVIVAVGILVYIAWVATRKNWVFARVDIQENEALRSSAVNASQVPPKGPEKAGAAEGARHILSGTSAQENNRRQPEQPTIAA
jgi:hypothetical protein